MACSSPPPARTGAAAQSTGAAAAQKLPPRAAFEIGNVNPAQLSVSGDQISTQSLEVSYSIPDPDTVAEAQLKLYVSEVGDLMTERVVPQAQGTMTFTLLPRQHSLGAHVQLRAACPAGVTDWYSLGQIPHDYSDRMANVFRISSVTPQSIPWSQGMDPSQSGAGARVSIFGPKLTADCRIEARINGASAELNNVHYYDRRFEGLLMFRDINYASIAPRYAELKLLVTRANGHRVQAVKRVPLATP